MTDHPTPQAVLVTVVGPTRRADVGLPATAFIAELIPAVVDMVAAGPGAVGAAWGLAPLGRQALPPDATLEGSGILDGAILYLRPLAPERPEPFIAVSSSFLEEEEGVDDEEELHQLGPRRGWTAVARARTLAMAAATSGGGVVLVLAAAAGTPDSRKAGITLGGALVLLFTAVLVRLTGGALEARDAISLAAVALGAGAAWWLDAAPIGGTAELLDRLAVVGAGVVVAGLVMAVAAPSPAAASLALIGGFGAVGAKLGEWLGSPAAKAAAPIAIAALVAVRAAPIVAAVASRPLRLATIVNSAPADDPSGEITAAQLLLTWLVRGLAVVLAVSLIVVDASLDEPFAVAAGVCGSAALLLQSLRFRFLADGLPLFAAGLAGLLALEGAVIARWAHQEGHPIRAAALAGALAVVLLACAAAIGAGGAWRRAALVVPGSGRRVPGERGPADAGPGGPGGEAGGGPARVSSGAEPSGTTAPRRGR